MISVKTRGDHGEILQFSLQNLNCIATFGQVSCPILNGDLLSIIDHAV